jgi:integrase
MTKAEKKQEKTTGVDVRATSIRLQFKGPDGTRHRITMVDAGGKPLPPTVANVNAAGRTMGDVRAAIRIGTFDLARHFPHLAQAPTTQPPKSITLGDQLDKYLAGAMVEDSTRAGYIAAVNFWKSVPCSDEPVNGALPMLADMPLNEIVFSEVRHALATGAMRSRRGKSENSKPLAAKTCNNYLAVLRSALDLAVDDGIIAKSPAGEGKKLRSKSQDEEPDPFSIDELDSIVAWIARKDQAAADYCEFWAMVGLRTSENNGLGWDSVDLRSGSILIHESRVRGKQKSSTKTKKSRTVWLNERARACIERQRARTQLAGGLVWANPYDGLPWDGYRDFIRSYWAPALRANGIRYRRPYNLRHTCATMLLMSGVMPALAAKQLGHSLQTFFKKYAKWIESANDLQELARVDAMLKGRSQGVSPQSSGI